MNQRIHLSLATVTDVEERYVLEALHSGWVAPLGPQVDAFEREVAERVGVRGALALNSGTAALHLALLDAGARPGTVVMLPSMTFAATANAVAYTGAEPVFVDCDLEDGNLDVDLLVRAVDQLDGEGAQIAAVVSVDLFGRCVRYGQLVPALAERGIPLVEDAAEALGASLDGRAAGAFGRCAALSFNGNKILTTSGGGMLLSDDMELLGRARHLATQAREPVAWYEHEQVGFNYRMSNLLAALGRAQLTRLDAMIARRRAIRQLYVDGLADLTGVRFLGRGGSRPDTHDNCWLTSVVFPDHLVPNGVDPLVEAMGDANIEVRHLWKPMHAQPVFAGARSFLTGAGDELFSHGLNLPSGAGLSDEDIARVLDVLRDQLGSQR